MVAIRKIFVTLISILLLMVLVPERNIVKAEHTGGDINDPAIHIRQSEDMCTLDANAMMIRRALIINGFGKEVWSKVTEETAKNKLWHGGMDFDYTFDNTAIGVSDHFSFDGTINHGTGTLPVRGYLNENKKTLEDLIPKHKEGVVIYAFGNGYEHAVLLTNIDDNGIYYCFDPSRDSPEIVPLGESTMYNVCKNIGHYSQGDLSNQDFIIKNVHQIWYIVSGVDEDNYVIHKHTYKNNGYCQEELNGSICGADYLVTSTFDDSVRADNGEIRKTRTANLILRDRPYKNANVLKEYRGNIYGEYIILPVIEKCKNHLGNTWYKVDISSLNIGQDFAYVYTDNSNVETNPIYIKGNNVIDFSDVDSSMSHIKGPIPVDTGQWVKGVVHSSNDLIKSVTVGLYYTWGDGNQSFTEYTADGINSTSYDIKQIDPYIHFKWINDPSTYIFRVTVRTDYQEERFEIPFYAYKDFPPSESSSQSNVVLSKFENLVNNVYKPGDRHYVDNAIWPHGGIQCYGFAREVFYQLFGTTFSDLDTNKYYIFREDQSDINNVTVIGQLLGSMITYDNVKNLLSNAKVGDVIQMVNGANKMKHHTMIVGRSIYDDGLEIYENNWSPYLTELDKHTWSGICSYTGSYSGSGITLYRASNYDMVNNSNIQPHTVRFVDYDGKEIASKQVLHGKNVTAPESPRREGYIFNGWDLSLNDVQNDRTIVAQYTPIVYNVCFLDCHDNVISEQHITYNNNTPGNALEPDISLLDIPPNYIFAGWSNDSWRNVMSDNIVVKPLIRWGSEDPVINISLNKIVVDGPVYYQPKGLYVLYSADIRSTVDVLGCIVARIKSADGTTIYGTASDVIYFGCTSSIDESFYIPVSDIYSGELDPDDLMVELYIADCDNLDYGLSNTIIAPVGFEKSGRWSSWMTEEEYENHCGAGDKDVFRVMSEYRSQSIELTDWTTEINPEGLPASDIRSVPGDWSEWSDWQREYVAQDDFTLVETRQIPLYETQYRYGRYVKNDGSGYHFSDRAGYSVYLNYTDWSSIDYNPVKLSNYYSSNNNSLGTGRWENGNYVWDRYEINGQYNVYYWEESREIESGSANEYRFAKREFHDEYRYHRYSDWSEWDSEEIIGNEHTNVEERVLFSVLESADEPEEYTLTIRTSNGVIASSERDLYQEGDVVSINVLLLPGYKDLIISGDFDSDSFVMPGNNVEIVCIASLEEYDISYDLDGGTNHFRNPLSYNVQSENITLFNPTKEGYRFIGWFDDNDIRISNIYSGSTGGITLIAKWLSEADYIDHFFENLMGDEERVVIPDGVTEIPNHAFANNSNLKSVVIPDSVTSIGDFAFNLCTSLELINIPNNVSFIGPYAFHACDSLVSIALPDELTTIGYNAFSNCISLERINIPASVESVGMGAFYRCPRLTIYAEASTKPEKWNEKWNLTVSSVIWDCLTEKPQYTVKVKTLEGVFAEYSERQFYENERVDLGVELLLGYEDLIIDGSEGLIISTDAGTYKNRYLFTMPAKNIELTVSASLIGHRHVDNNCDDICDDCEEFISYTTYKELNKIRDQAYQYLESNDYSDISYMALEDAVNNSSRLDEESSPELIDESCKAITHAIARLKYATVDVLTVCDPVNSGNLAGGGRYAGGETVSLNAARTVTGYYFAGWYLNDELIADEPTYDYPIDGDHSGELRFVAKFEANGDKTLNVNVGRGIVNYRYNNEYGLWFNNIIGEKLPLGTKMTVSAAPDYNCEFLYWVNTNNGRVISNSKDYTFLVNDNIDITACYKVSRPGYHYVIFKDFNGKVLLAKDYREGQTIVAPEHGNFAGYDFAGWDKEFSIANEDMIITATYTPRSGYRFVVNGGCVEDEKEVYSHGDSVTLVADEMRDNNYFSGWYNGNGDQISCNAISKVLLIKDFETYTARYEGVMPIVPEAICVADFAEREDIADNGQKIIPMVRWELPEGYEVIEGGLIRTYNPAYVNRLSIDNVDGSNIRINASDKKGLITYYALTINASAATAKNDMYAKAYIKYLDQNGKECVRYSDIKVSLGKAE